MSHSKINSILLAFAITLIIIVFWLFISGTAQNNFLISPPVPVQTNINPTPNPTPTPTPTPVLGNVFKTVGEREGEFLISKINSDTVEGTWYDLTGVTSWNPKGVYKILKVGDDVGYACEGISEKITGIDITTQKVTFDRIESTPPKGGCPL